MPSAASEGLRAVLSNPDFTVIRGPHQAYRLQECVAEIDAAARMIGVDTETTGLDPHENQVRLVQIASRDRALLVDLDGWRTSGQRQVDWEQPGLHELGALLRSAKPKVLQNASFDLNFLRGEGVVLGGAIFDTMVAAKIINNGTGAKNDLGSIVSRVFLVELPKELQKAKWDGELSEEMLEYAARDALCLVWLAQTLQRSLKESRVLETKFLWEVFHLEMEVLRPIALMQWYGFAFDLDAARELREQLNEEAEALKLILLENLDREIRRRHPNNPQVWLPRDGEDGPFNTREKDVGSIRLGTKKLKGFNPRSTDQMTERLTQAGIRLRPNEKGKLSLDQNLLAFLRNDYELIDKYLNWKEAVTKVSNIEKLIESNGSDQRVHANYRQMGTDTGRLSCSSPNLQQVNRGADFRSKFVAAPGMVLVVADFSQVELRVAAELSGEQRMIDAYLAGRDLHTETAARLKGVELEDVTKADRTSAKIANFGLLYGAGPVTLQKQAVSQYGVDMSLEEAREIVEAFRAAYPQLYKWQQTEGSKTEEAIFTAIGRRRLLYGFNDKYTTRINTQVQGTAGDIAKIAIRNIWQQLRDVSSAEARLIAMVHDEIVLEVAEAQAEDWGNRLQHAMESAGAEVCQKVPIVAEVSWGTTWADAK